MRSLHYTSKKLGHDCKSRAEYWQQSGRSTVSDCKKLNASPRQENNLLKLIVLFFFSSKKESAMLRPICIEAQLLSLPLNMLEYIIIYEYDCKI